MHSFGTKTWALALFVVFNSIAMVSCQSGIEGTDGPVSDTTLNATDVEELSAILMTEGGTFERGKLITFQFRGEYACEYHQGNANSAQPNPFRHYQCFLEIRHGDDNSYATEPHIFFNATINPAELDPATADDPKCGYVWQARFRPDRSGPHNWSARCMRGQDIGLEPYAPNFQGTPVAPNGELGSFNVAESNSPGFYKIDPKGNLISDTGKHFLKTGHDSPENFLAYYEIDDFMKNPGGNVTYTLGADGHNYATHGADYQGGGKTWQNGKGVNIFGAIDYMISQGMNSQYMVTFNSAVEGYSGQGDSNDVWPHACNPKDDVDCLKVFDVSRLQQYDHIFNYMTKRGVQQHILFGEQEVDQMFGGMTVRRKLFYKEFIARFAHHPNLVWNLGEEWDVYSDDDQDVDLAKQALDYIASHDPNDHPRGLHSFPSDIQSLYNDLIVHPTFTYMSIQENSNNGRYFHGLVKEFRQKALCIHPSSPANCVPHGVGIAGDEAGPGMNTAYPGNGLGTTHHRLRERKNAGVFFAANAIGVEWYRGYGSSQSDVNMENFRAFHEFDKQSVALRRYLQQHFNYRDLVNDNGVADLVSTPNEQYPGEKDPYVLRTNNHRKYAIYNKDGDDLYLDLPQNLTFTGYFWDAENDTNGPTICINGGNNVLVNQWPWGNGRDTVLRLEAQSAACP